MKVKFKKLHIGAVEPKKAHKADAGFDLTATSKKFDKDGNVVYGTGIAVEIPAGYMGLVFPRSSNAKKSCLLSNSVGVIDSGFTGEITMKFRLGREMGVERIPHPRTLWDKFTGVVRTSIKIKDEYSTENLYDVGDRIGQLVIMPRPNIEFIEVDELSETDRGDGSYGSTGK